MLINMRVIPGLEGVVAAETSLSLVDGERGQLIIAGYPVEELAPRATFEEVAELLGVRRLAAIFDKGKAAVSPGTPGMDALRMAIAALPSTADAAEIIGAFPAIIAAHARLQHGLGPIAPRADLGYAANYLYMLDGEVPSPPRVRALDTYLNTVVDHGLNASTFTARVIASTGSDLVSVVTGAIGALKGPLHGGAPGPALDLVFAIGDASRAEEVLRRKLEGGERLMGFVIACTRFAIRAPTFSPQQPSACSAAEPPTAESMTSPARSKRSPFGSSINTSPAATCGRTSSSTPRCCCTAWVSTPRCSHRPSR